MDVVFFLELNGIKLFVVHLCTDKEESHDGQILYNTAYLTTKTTGWEQREWENWKKHELILIAILFSFREKNAS